MLIKYYRWLFTNPYHFLAVYFAVSIVYWLCTKAAIEPVEGLWNDEDDWESRRTT